MRAFLLSAVVAAVSLGSAVADDLAPYVDPSLHAIEPEGELSSLPEETRQLVGDLSASAKSTAELFEEMTKEQLDFRPPDESHTPRWNAEHLAGAQILFFSKYFHSLDDRLPVVERMPKQSPEDYEPWHPDWDGAEEAGWIREADAYVRRYAYLLKDVDLDAPVQDDVLPPFFKTPRSLLKGLAGHWSEHTANVQKKFATDGWPKE